eukprot:2908934-Heterocapsa_arctica.AAC.1
MDHIGAIADDVEPLHSVLSHPHSRVELRPGDGLPTRRSAIGPFPFSCRPTPGDAPGRPA